MKRGWIVFPNGKRQELLQHLVEHEEITWPPTLPEKQPGEAVEYINMKDMYRRHEVVPDEAYVFLQNSDAAAKVPDDIMQWVRDQMKVPPTSH